MDPPGGRFDQDDGRDPLLGLVVANHRVLARVGQGGMGTVYLAQHTVLGRKAAIKVLQPEFSNNRDLVGRFFNEARATAQLRYRGFVEIFDSGVLPDGSAYLVMEYLRGVNLAASIEWRRTLAVDQTLAVLREVAGSITYAHKHGIVHRDLKPDNIFVAVDRDEASGRDRATIKVLDFGIAKLSGMAAGAGDGSSRTRTGSLLGTPLYMSPEQCRGSGQVDHRTDIYSLGCIAYHALTGQPPFAFEGFGEIIAAHLNRPPEPLRIRAPAVPEAVELFVLALLAKDPGERPQTMQDVMAGLDQLAPALPGAAPEMLALVPPAALVEEAVPFAPPVGPRVATTPMPNASPPSMLAPLPSGKSGETRRLPTGAGLPGGHRSVSTLGGAATAMDDGLPVPRLRGGGRGRTIGVAVAVGGALVIGLVLAFGGFGGSRTQRNMKRGESAPVAVEPSGSAEPSPAAAARPADWAAGGAQRPEASEHPTGVPGTTSLGNVQPGERAVEPEPTTVVVRISSAPAGASIVEAKSGKALGETPFQGKFPRRDRAIELLVRKPGFHTKKLAVALDRDASLTVTLERAAAVRAPADEDSDDRRKL